MTNDLTGLLQRGLFEEEANRNLDAAIANYESLAKQFDKDRQIAATAVFRLGECYRKLGRTNDAVIQYERILRDFSDQQTLATLSRQNVAGLKGAETPAPATHLDQRELLQKQIALAEQDATEVKKKFEVGAGATQADIRAAEREVLRLRQQLAALTPPFKQDLLLDLSVPDDEEKEIRRIQAMIQNSPDLINAVNGNSGTPLFQAAKNGQLRVAAFLLDHSADVNTRSGIPIGQEGGNWTPLMVATDSGHKSMIELLLDRGADVNAKSGGTGTALHIACKRGFRAITDVLLRHKADPNATDWEKTPLHEAAANGNLQIVNALIAAGADINAKAPTGSPMWMAVWLGKIDVVKALLAAKADPNIPDKDGLTPLCIAAQSGRLELVELLLAAKADPNLAAHSDKEQDRTPLHYAAQKDAAPVVQALLKAGANPNAKSRLVNSSNYKGGETPLLSAIARERRTEVVDLLLDFKADPNLANAGGGTPLGMALASGNVAITETLLRRGANANAANPLRWNPLWLCVNNGNKSLVETLLKFNPDINARNPDGQTALDLCKVKIAQEKEEGSKAALEEIAGLLRKHGALDDFPKWDRLLVRRPRETSAQLVALKTEKANQYSLLELLVSYYKIPTAPNNIDFPDLSRIVVRRPQADGKKWTELEIDLKPNDISSTCTNDFPLEWGDIVEIPQTDHVLNEVWQGFPLTMADRIEKCLSRTVTVKFRTEVKNIILMPSVSRGSSGIYITDLWFNVGAAIDKAGFNRSSANLSRVKVVRQTGGKTQEWVLDCSKAPPLLLRDGDVVEVPER